MRQSRWQDRVCFLGLTVMLVKLYLMLANCMYTHQAEKAADIERERSRIEQMAFPPDQRKQQ
jgi:hypothetical protein